MNDLDALKQKLSIESFEKLTNEQMTEILKLHGQGQISIGQLQQIALMVPHFSAVAQEAAKTLSCIASSAAYSQKAALDELGKTRDAILSLASHPSADKEIIKMIIDKLSELAVQFERMNTSNNGLFSRIKDGLAIVGVVLGGLLAIGAAVESRNKA